MQYPADIDNLVEKTLILLSEDESLITKDVILAKYDQELQSWLKFQKRWVIWFTEKGNHYIL